MTSESAMPPFRSVVVATGPDVVDADPNSFEPYAADDELSADALEAAYLRALEVANAATAVEHELEIVAADAATGPDVQQSPLEQTDSPRTDHAPVAEPQPASNDDSHAPGVTPRQVVEALLFVGGQPLTGKRLAELLGGEFTHDHVDRLVDELNDLYGQEGRPYEVRLGEGGYRLELRPEFERVRDRVYGYGPKEVKLSQDALEVLALVAYQQPVTREIVEQTGKTNAPALLRQLLQRELISLRRGDGGKDDVTYRTTPRFLQLFGLGSLDDLPLPEDLMFK